MRLPFLLVLGVLAGCAQPDEPAAVETVDEPAAVEVASFDGEWSMDAMPLDSDSVLVTSRLIASDSPDGWSLTFDHLDAPVPATEVSIDGETAIATFAPYASALREGVMVDTLRTTLRVGFTGLDGEFTAHYADGQVTNGRLRGYR
jgi:hypothetical protein